ncbi:MAG: hypothetical protein WAV28_15920 [Sedimentisphaerales bacterium]|jgi:uncharacterized protein YdaU (DUF1376 family)
MKIKYVQLESEAFLTDLDYITTSHAERSVYCTLIFYLTSNNGRCEYKPSALSKLCYCESVEEFEEIWQNISKKFQTRNGVIKHKRVTKELRRAKKFIQHQRKAGLASAKKRQQQLNHGSIGVTSPVQPTNPKRNVNEKEKKVNTNTYTKEQSLSSSNSLRALSFNEALLSIIRPRNQSDRTCFRNITNWLMVGCATGRFNGEIFDRVLDYARKASTGRNPAAVFIALLKKELGYRPGK